MGSCWILRQLQTAKQLATKIHSRSSSLRLCEWADDNGIARLLEDIARNGGDEAGGVVQAMLGSGGGEGEGDDETRNPAYPKGCYYHEHPSGSPECTTAAGE